MPQTAPTLFSPLSEALQRAFEDEDPRPLVKEHEQAQVESLKRLMDSVGLGDIAQFELCLDPNIEMEIHAPSEFPWIRRARGADAVRAAVTHNFASVEDQVPQVLTVVAQGNLVDVTLRETGRIRNSGYSYDIVGVQQFQFRRGRLVRFSEVIAHRTPE